MKRLLVISLAVLSFFLSTTLSAKEENRQSGVETSAEHKSEQGLEKGKAYAGTKEVTDKEDKEKKEKKVKGKKKDDENADEEDDEEVTDDDVDKKEKKGKKEKKSKKEK